MRACALTDRLQFGNVSGGPLQQLRQEGVNRSVVGRQELTPLGAGLELSRNCHHLREQRASLHCTALHKSMGAVPLQQELHPLQVKVCCVPAFLWGTVSS